MDNNLIGFKGTERERQGQWNTLITLRQLARDRSIAVETLDKHKRLYDYMFSEYIGVAA